MSLLEPLLALGGDAPAPVGLGMVALMGVSMGLTACAASCLPFIGVWSLGREGGGRAALADLAAFLAGRLLGYALLGLLAGAAGDWLVARFDAAVGHVAIGVAGIVAGILLVVGPGRRSGGGCGGGWRRQPGAPLLLGLALSLTPCAPLSTLLAAATMAADPWLGAGYGLAFGLGAAVTPLVVILPLIRALGGRIQARAALLARGLRWGSGGALALIGLRRLLLVGGV